MFEALFKYPIHSRMRYMPNTKYTSPNYILGLTLMEITTQKREDFAIRNKEPGPLKSLSFQIARTC